MYVESQQNDDCEFNFEQQSLRETVQQSLPVEQQSDDTFTCWLEWQQPPEKGQPNSLTSACPATPKAPVMTTTAINLVNMDFLQ